jgi:2-methylisocitrate lyase-like PEP mutase family enzyme
MPDPAFGRRGAAFRKLHASGCFVIPNPWDIGTARYLAHLGFQALATTSAGFAFSQGLPDASGAVPRDLVLKHIAEIVSATELPVNADFESGYAHDPEGVGASVRLCLDTGVAGLSIEDATGHRENPLYELPRAADRIRAARSAIDASKSNVLLTGRAECFLTGHPEPLRESIRRLQAYAEAGADVLYAPGVREPADIQAIVAAVHPKPVNVLMTAGTRVGDLAALGVRRISLGSSLARAAWGGFIGAAKLLADEGSSSRLDGATPYAELNAFFGDVE